MAISSFDSGFFQLINGQVSVLHYRGKKTAAWLLNEFSTLENGKRTNEVLKGIGLM